MPRIRRGAFQTRAATAPHTASHTTSFRRPVHSDLLWKHRDSHTSLLSNWHIVPRLPCSLLWNWHIVPRLPRSLLSNWHIAPRLPRGWAIQAWATCDYVSPHHICISIILRKAILPCFPQYNCAHQNLSPELDGARSRPAPQPLRTQRLTPLAFATPCTQIYCENTGIRTLPYFQTGTLSHACHVPYFPTCTLSHTCHVTELFKRELPVIMWAHTTFASALYCEKQSFLASPNITAHAKLWKKIMPRIRRGAATAPHTASHTTSFRRPMHSDLLWKHRDSHTSLLSNCHIVLRLPRSLLSNLHIVPRLPRSLLSNWHIAPRLPRGWAIQAWATCDYVSPHHICISIILRKAILPCFPQYNCAHQNLKEKPCPELDGARSRPAPQPLRTQRLTPLAFATPCTQIYCENIGIRTLPYFQTGTLSHACHVPYFETGTLSHAYHVPYFQTCTLSHTSHVTELFKCELPLDYSTTWLS